MSNITNFNNRHLVPSHHIIQQSIFIPSGVITVKPLSIVPGSVVQFIWSLSESYFKYGSRIFVFPDPLFLFQTPDENDGGFTVYRFPTSTIKIITPEGINIDCWTSQMFNISSNTANHTSYQFLTITTKNHCTFTNWNNATWHLWHISTLIHPQTQYENVSKANVLLPAYNFLTGETY
jgi:hypothetical protein